QLLRRPQPLLQFADAILRCALLGTQELGGPFRLHLAAARVLLDEHLGEFLGDALRALGGAIEIDDVERIELRVTLRSRDRGRYFHLDPIEQILDYLIERPVGDQALFARHALENGRTAQLLRERAEPLLPTEAGARRHQVGDRGRLDPNARARSVGDRKEKSERHTTDDTQRERNGEPYSASRQDAEILDRMHGSFDHFCFTPSDGLATPISMGQPYSPSLSLRYDDHVARFDAHGFAL